jgi:AraC-like DNA-binding protein
LISLSVDDLASLGESVLGRHPIGSATSFIVPHPDLMARMLRLHESAGNLAIAAPELLARPEVARAIEQELATAMMACLSEATATNEAIRGRGRGRLPAMRRFERFIEENADRPLFVAEACAAAGVSERALRSYCFEHTGLSTHRYLWLRRMHLARRALGVADPATSSVTEVATDFGFWELGRFAVTYREIFGESPSSTLHRPPASAPGLSGLSP